MAKIIFHHGDMKGEFISWTDGAALCKFFDENGVETLIYLSESMLALRVRNGPKINFTEHPQPYPGWLPAGWPHPMGLPHEKLTYKTIAGAH
jgi:hypothetical protein